MAFGFKQKKQKSATNPHPSRRSQDRKLFSAICGSALTLEVDPHVCIFPILFERSQETAYSTAFCTRTSPSSGPGASQLCTSLSTEHSWDKHWNFSKKDCNTNYGWKHLCFQGTTCALEHLADLGSICLLTHAAKAAGRGKHKSQTAVRRQICSEICHRLKWTLWRALRLQRNI